MKLPLAALYQLCTPMLGSLAALPEPQQRALRVAFGLAAGPTPDRFVLDLAVLSLLAENAAARPLVCLVDDAQWLDEASSQVLGFVGRRLLAEPVGLLFAVREAVDERLFPGLPALTVEGLTDVPGAPEKLREAAGWLEKARAKAGTSRTTRSTRRSRSSTGISAGTIRTGAPPPTRSSCCSTAMWATRVVCASSRSGRREPGPPASGWNATASTSPRTSSWTRRWASAAARRARRSGACGRAAGLLPARAPRGGARAGGLVEELGSVALVPLLALHRPPGGRRAAARFAAAFALVSAALFAPALAHSSPAELVTRTFGFQLTRPDANSIWSSSGRMASWGGASWAPTLGGALRGVCAALAGGLVVVLMLERRPRGTAALAAACAAILIALVACAGYFSFAYVLWFAPLAMLASLAEMHAAAPAAPARAPRPRRAPMRRPRRALPGRSRSPSGAGSAR